ncbi:hypothetical protein CFC21_052050 [Triticum aestivum]|uniref:DUF834 domain-containing protein n=2 Tax=Triticum aestivum TaxID=4565 RepID=A0A3B6HVD2_WHEAT|nr:hypothetical protein CFC21_052050 [Triticum aestivum]
MAEELLWELGMELVACEAAAEAGHDDEVFRLVGCSAAQDKRGRPELGPGGSRRRAKWALLLSARHGSCPATVQREGEKRVKGRKKQREEGELRGGGEGPGMIAAAELAVVDGCTSGSGHGEGWIEGRRLTARGSMEVGGGAGLAQEGVRGSRGRFFGAAAAGRDKPPMF